MSEIKYETITRSALLRACIGTLHVGRHVSCWRRGMGRGKDEGGMMNDEKKKLSA